MSNRFRAAVGCAVFIAAGCGPAAPTTQKSEKVGVTTTKDGKPADYKSAYKERYDQTQKENAEKAKKPPAATSP